MTAMKGSIARLGAGLLAATTLAGCSGLPLAGKAEEATATQAPAQPAAEFLADYDREVRPRRREAITAAWVQATHITPDTQMLAARAAERLLGFTGERAQAARAYPVEQLPPAQARQLRLLQRAGDVPASAAQLAELTELASQLEAMYGSGEYCPPGGGEECLDLGQLEEIIATSRDPAVLLDAWQGWRQIAPPMRPLYQRFVELKNSGAQEVGYADAGALWRGGYDMPADDLTAVVEDLWAQVQPLYQALHCHVRAELVAEYGPEVVDPVGPLPAHLLGNMWAQTWDKLYPRLIPFPEQAGLDVTGALQAQEYSSTRMVRQAEDFYVGLGLPALPPSFYQHSMLEQPADRAVVCHASAWSLDLDQDVRIKMCIQPDEQNLVTIYHELGHIYYNLAYREQPVLFQGGAHDGFHEAIGDTLVLSLTPEYLHSVGLVPEPAANPKAVVNQQLKQALSKVAFLPFGLLVDKWRWQVFSGEVGPEQYNAAWWDLRQRYQGVAPPLPRAADAFDPGAKYHIPGDTPYLRYFLSFVLQFQFYQALCETAGHDGPLHQCSFAGNTAVGQSLWEMLQLGQSRPWQDALETLTGGREMDARPLLQYFAPLAEYLAQENQGRQCGWAQPSS